MHEPLLQYWDVGQSQFVEQVVATGQYPSVQVPPFGQVVVELHCWRHCPLTQSLPDGQSVATVHAGVKFWHTPDWQLCPAGQSVSTAQVTWHAPLMQTCAVPQSEAVAHAPFDEVPASGLPELGGRAPGAAQ